MKTVSSLLCILLTLPAAAEQQRETIAKTAREKRGAVMQIGPGDRVTGGCFISEDGFALCLLEGILPGTSPPLVSTFRDRDLIREPAEIRAVFHDPGLVLLKLDHRPKTWLRLSASGCEVGTMVAILDGMSGNPFAVGPVVARRSSIAIHSRKTSFHKVFSIGSCLRGGVEGQPNTGIPVVNSEGELVGLYQNITPTGRQFLLTAYPLADLTERISEARRKNKAIPLPLDPDMIPSDFAGHCPNFVAAVKAMHQRDYDRADELAVAVLMKHPGSRLVHNLRADIAMMSGNRPALEQRLADLDPGDQATAPERIAYLKHLQVLRKRQGRMDEAIKALEESVRLSPPDYPDDRGMLAALLAQSGRMDEAEKYYRLALVGAPEDLRFLDGLSMVLTARQKWAEEAELTNRVFEIESLYRRR